MFVNNESTAGVGNDKPVSILSDHFILSCFLDVAVITPMICSCFPVITFIAVDVEKKFTMILLVFVDKIAFLA